MVPQATATFAMYGLASAAAADIEHRGQQKSFVGRSIATSLCSNKALNYVMVHICACTCATSQGRFEDLPFNVSTLVSQLHGRRAACRVPYSPQVADVSLLRAQLSSGLVQGSKLARRLRTACVLVLARLLKSCRSLQPVKAVRLCWCLSTQALLCTK